MPADAFDARLDAHCAALAACRRCAAELPPGALPVIPESRAPRAMLVGQAPGPTEATSRRPFQGRAGKTLFRWLARAGLDEAQAREFFWIAAVTRCYPGPHPSGRGDRVPTPGERARCAPWLEAEFALVRPALVVTLGRLAVDRFLAPAPLTALVGGVHPATRGGRAFPVLPLPHPSGASGWLNVAAHRSLLDAALDRLAVEVRRVGDRTPARDAAA
ncbi:MAG TPA: uracil-DNA glycosylase [Gemmatirosa sp.]